MEGIMWGYPEPPPADDLRGFMGSLGSLGIEWGFKIKEKPVPPFYGKGRFLRPESSEEDVGKTSDEKIKLKEKDYEELSAFQIESENKQLMCFRDSLLVMKRDPRATLGEFSIKVEAMDKSDFAVHLSCTCSDANTSWSTTVTTGVTNNLITLDEKFYECVKTNKTDGTKDIKEMHFYIAQDKNKEGEPCFQVSCTQKTSNGIERETKECTYYKNFLSEGAYLLLLRFMAVTGFTGKAKCVGLLKDATSFPITLSSDGPKPKSVNGVKVDVYEIKRTGTDVTGKQQQLLSVLTKTGHLIEHVWINGNFALEVSPKAAITGNTTHAYGLPIPMHKNWRSDLQAVSVFTDRKTLSMARCNAYIHDHPEVKNLLADYLQAILLAKPNHVLPFTIQYFSAFAKDIKHENEDNLSSTSDTD